MNTKENLVAITTNEESLISQTKLLADELHILYETDATKDYRYHLLLTKTHLELQSTIENYRPVKIDFLSGKNTVRKQSSYKNELIAKAVGIKSLYRPKILDISAGLMRDAFLLASYGCEVICLERSSILYALVHDALQRLYVIDSSYIAKLKLVYINAQDYLKNLQKDHYPEVIYFDPMYPHRDKSALVKKEMRILREIVGADEDCVEIFSLAKKYALNRVVVKRPSFADYITDEQPSMSFEGKSTRFDVYISL